MLHKRYLVKRGSVFYFRWRVPDILRPLLWLTEVTRSLGTGSPRLAIGRSAVYLAAIYELLEAQSNLELGQHSKAQLEAKTNSLLEQLGYLPSKNLRRRSREMTQEAPHTSNDRESLLLLSQAIEMFVKSKNWKARYEKEACRGLKFLLIAIGDKDIKNIRRKHLREALELLEGLPKANISPYC